MKKFFVTIFYLLFSFYLIFSVKKIPDYASGIENIKHNLERENIDLFEAYIETQKFLSTLENNDKDFNNAKLFLDEIINKFNDRAIEEYKLENYDNALRYALSLDAIQKKSTISIKDIYNNIAIKADASSDLITKFDVKEEMADMMLMSNKEIYDFLEELAKNKNKGNFLYLLNNYSLKYKNLTKQYPDLIKYKLMMEKYRNLEFEEMMKSVVLVILDKGLTAKGGYKISDKSIGTGFFIDDKGYILTNHHVIADHVDPKYEGFSSVKILTKDKQNGPPIPAKVIGYDKVFDIALLKIPVQNENYLTMGRSLDMSIGDKIYTIGNPLGIQYTVTSGIISNKNIAAFQLGRCFMIDAAINPGNSGGPLIDDSGQVVGIVFAGIPLYEGLNFAIPFQWVRNSITSLYKGNEVKRCWIAGGIYENNSQIKFYYIMPNGPAYKAGIRTGDRILKINNEEVKSVEDAQSKLAWKRFPMLLEIEIERENKTLKKIVRLEERPLIPVEEVFKKDTFGNIITLVFGIGLEYYGKGIFVKKYKTTKIYKGIYSPFYDIDLDIGEDSLITVYDLKYVEKDESVYLTVKYRNKDIGVVERIATLRMPAAINSII